jgi:hypothetical protein
MATNQIGSTVRLIDAPKWNTGTVLVDQGVTAFRKGQLTGANDVVLVKWDNTLLTNNHVVGALMLAT